MSGGLSFDLKCPGNETPEHFDARLMAAGWLWNYGCRVIGFDVGIGRHEADVVGVRWPKGEGR